MGNFERRMAMNILFTCVGRRNYLLNYLREVLQPEDKIFGADMQMTAPGMAECDVPIIVPSIYDHTYINKLCEAVYDNHIKGIISLNDLELPILAAHRQELEAHGAKLIVSDERVIDLTFDKLKTAQFLTDIGLRTPQTYVRREDFDVARDRGQIDLPVVVKPRFGSASIDIEMPKTLDELLLVEKLARLRLERSILSTASSSHPDEALLYQEFLPGQEYGMDVLNDLEGNYVGTFVRKKLSMRAGETDKATTVIDSRFEKIGRTISERLRHIGNLDCDIMEKNGEYYVLEMNARFGGGYPFSHEGGAKGICCYYEWLKGETNTTRYLDYKAGLTFSKCDRIIKIPE